MAVTVVKPPQLLSGDKVAAISLSWGGAAAFSERYTLGKKRFQDFFGVEIVETRHALREPEWLYKNPEARAEDLMEAFADPSIKGIVSIIGGEESVRLAPHVDLSVIRKHPKIFMGYSDTTVSHILCLTAGLSSFYGPSILAEFAENVETFSYTVESVRRTLFSAEPVCELQPSERWTGQRLPWKPENTCVRRKTSKNFGPRLLQGKGIVRGPLIGGCLDVLEFLRGTPFWPAPEVWNGAILFLETSEERPPINAFRYWIRGYASMGILPRVKGVLLGRPMCGPRGKKLDAYDETLQKIVSVECGLKDLPIMTRLDFGHSDPKFVLPLGQEIEMDCERRRLSLPKPAVLARVL